MIIWHDHAVVSHTGLRVRHRLREALLRMGRLLRGGHDLHSAAAVVPELRRDDARQKRGRVHGFRAGSCE